MRKRFSEWAADLKTDFEVWLIMRLLRALGYRIAVLVPPRPTGPTLPNAA